MSVTNMLWKTLIKFQSHLQFTWKRYSQNTAILVHIAEWFVVKIQVKMLKPHLEHLENSRNHETWQGGLKICWKYSYYILGVEIN